MSGITIQDLRKKHGTLEILKAVNLTIEPGEFTVLLGPSGCGKSTLLNAIAGLDGIDEGNILIGGKDVSTLDPSKRGISMVFQSYALYPTMSVRKNLSFGLTVTRVPKAEIDKRVSSVARMLQIEPLLDRKPGALSGGQRQRVAIGRALVKQSKVFLFDEPLSNLDAKLRTETRLELKRLHAELGATMLYVTHDQVEAMTLATRVAVMNKGLVEQYAAPEELYERPSTKFVAAFVGSPSMNFITGELMSARRMRVGDRSLDLSAYPFVSSDTKPQDIVLGVRPEHVVLCDGSAPDSFAASKLFIEPMGADTIGWFEIAGQKISARLQPATARSLGDIAHLRFDATKVSLFDRTTEKRI